MAALPLNTAPHFIFYYRFCNSLDFYCSLHPKKLVLSFSRTFCDYQGDFFKIQGQIALCYNSRSFPGPRSFSRTFQGLCEPCLWGFDHSECNRIKLQCCGKYWSIQVTKREWVLWVLHGTSTKKLFYGQTRAKAMLNIFMQEESHCPICIFPNNLEQFLYY